MSRLKVLGCVLHVAAVAGVTCPGLAQETRQAPRIVNIINFVRLLEPRSEAITEEVLYQTVVSQAQRMAEHRLPGTFLLQYDALMDERYQAFLKELPRDQFEVGGWWEIPQPLVEKAGLRWRGRYPWDWHAHVGFSSGYTPPEREKLVDVYMADFHKIFGRYPRSVASWFIDAHTLKYMHERYGIVASANCKDQVGTDGYTLWGGYINQAYYPSQRNAYMPAQTEDAQIPVPVFRMLGSDPLRQYDTGVGHTHQGVITLEPIYREGGGDPEWVEWYFENFIRGECLAFNYVQAGQENSFTWEAMREGLDQQFPLIAQLRDKGKLRVETLEQSGRWFRKEFRTTPATAVAFQTPLRGDKRQAIWFNSRYYRAGVIWEDGTLRIRDIHLFDESVESPILKHKIEGPTVEFYALPLVDGFHWSSKEILAGLRFMTRLDGQEAPLQGPPPEVTRTRSGGLRVAWSLSAAGGELELTFTDDLMHITFEKARSPWWLELAAAEEARLPHTRVAMRSITYSFRGSEYRVVAERGGFEQQDNTIRIRPGNSGTLTLRLSALNEKKMATAP